MEDPHKKHQFQTLDALRGVASIMVVVLHAGSRSFPIQPHYAYLAVDLFFVLSGFVLSFAYQRRLDSGMSTLTFLKFRLIRLAPLYLLANVLGLGVNVWLRVLGPFALAWHTYLLYFVAGSLFLPVPGAFAMFPLVQPAWTLLLELVANLAHALFGRSRSLKSLLVVCVCAGLCLCAAVYHFQSENIGWMGHHSFILAGIPRVAFSYTAGMCLYRVYSARQPSRRSAGGPIAAWAVLALATFTLSFYPPHDLVVGLLLIFFAMPSLVYLGAQVEPGRFLRHTFGALGATSYAIYVIHDPILVLLNSTAAFPRSGITGGCLLVAGLTAASLLLDRYWDIPLRRSLRKFAS